MNFAIPGMLIILTACSQAPIIHSYRSGLKIVRVDQNTLDRICSHISDDGEYIEHAAGCYDRSEDIIYIQNSCLGARTLPHELAHRDGMARPGKHGFDW